ncbi:ATP-binding protein [Roseobacter sp. HKCCA0434]|uniref:ATP-binding protein n=1 Tax=Roseobacter sp. HKCCA0434 TaxID=3079297 RepID=UPI002905A0E0|nr:ATP-binding protein [Roseobacter sp. HKCCA0434]
MSAGNLQGLDHGRVLSKDHAARARAAAEEDHLYSSSPIARRIVLFNLLAQAFLVIGILFLSRFESSLVDMRAEALARDAALIAETIDQFALDTESGSINIGQARAIVTRIGRVSASRVRLFDTDARTIADTREARPDGDGVPVPSEAPRPTYIYDQVIDRLAALTRRGDVAQEAVLSRAQLDKAVADALSGVTSQVVSGDASGNYRLTLALPLAVRGAPVGALVLSTRAGDIPELVSRERRQLMTVFLLALTVSIGLSVVLANSIARPLRVLANAAQAASRSTRDMAPERISFPDLTGRPDEIGNLSRALILMTQALYERIEANEVFAADVAHEIKNPLTSLRSAVETMEYAKTDEQRARLLGVIAKDVQRLDRLVTDISNASRLDSELVREEMEPFDLAALASSLVSYNQDLAADGGVTLQAKSPDRPVMVPGLEGRLAQVIVNLITNAISFTPPDGTVSVEVSEDDEVAVIRVEDTGPGIPPENLEDVFSRFYSERPGQEFGNHSGLGLAISKQIVEAHGGTIRAANRMDEAGSILGARFTVRLPK